MALPKSIKGLAKMHRDSLDEQDLIIEILKRPPPDHKWKRLLEEIRENQRKRNATTA